MPTLNICGALIGADFHSLRPTKRSRSPISSASPTQRLFCGSYHRRCKLKSETLLSRSRQISSSSPGIDLRCVDNGSETTLELMDYGHSTEDKLQEVSSFPSGLKLTVLTVLLMLLDSQQAIASTEFAGAQLISYMGDLGDISTGFASVRRTSFLTSDANIHVPQVFDNLFFSFMKSACFACSSEIRKNKKNILSLFLIF